MSLYQPIKRLVKHSAVYGVGHVLSRSVGFLLLPLYTNLFSTDGFGVAGLAMTWLSILTLLFNNASDFPDNKLVPNATRRLNLVIPEGDTPDKDDFTAQNFLKAVMIFYGVDRAQALQMLRTGIDTSNFTGRSGHVELFQKHGKEKDADTGVEKEVTRQDMRLIRLAEDIAHGDTFLDLVAGVGGHGHSSFSSKAARSNCLPRKMRDLMAATVQPSMWATSSRDSSRR